MTLTVLKSIGQKVNKTFEKDNRGTQNEEEER